jgi:hypothetical protein
MEHFENKPAKENHDDDTFERVEGYRLGRLTREAGARSIHRWRLGLPFPLIVTKASIPRLSERLLTPQSFGSLSIGIDPKKPSGELAEGPMAKSSV